MEPHQGRYTNYLFMLIILIVLILSYMVLKDFLVCIMNAMVLTFIFYPIYRWLNKNTGRKYLSSLIVTILILLITTLLIIFLFHGVSKESSNAYTYLKKMVGDIELTKEECESFTCELSNGVIDIVHKYDLKNNLEIAITSIGKKIYSWSFMVLFKIPTKIIHFLIMLFIIFFLLVEGNRFLEYIKNIIPLEKKHQASILLQIKEIIYAVIYGQIIIAILEGVLGGLIFFILGISNPVLWGIVMAILALLPFVGASFVWLPAALYLIAQGISSSHNILILKAIILIVYGIVIIGGVEMLLKPMIIGKRTRIHPIIILLGILGGLSVFGIGGLILGPVILGLMITFIKIYEEEK